MTREEATSLLKSRVDLIKSNYPEIDDYCEALEMAIEALKQGTCKDCISRQEALNAITMAEVRWQAIDNVDKLKSVTPQPKMGHWIDKKCSVCGCGSMLGLCVEKYCPNCGAKMVEPQESEE